MIYPEDFESKIGFDNIRNAIAEKCISKMGKEEVVRMSFSSDINVVRTRLLCVDEMVRIIKNNFPLDITSVSDVLPYLSELHAASSYISSEKLLRLMRMLETIASVSSFFKKYRDEETGVSEFPTLEGELSGLESFPLLIEEISRAVNKFGEIKDNASPELYDIRQSIRSASGSIQRVMKRVLENAVARGVVEKDATPSLRDGRMVIPVSAGNKRQISGIVHDESATGKTVFIEPAEVVEAGNRLRELEMEERREIILILIRLADGIRPYIRNIADSCLLLGYLDFVASKAKFAIETEAQMPNLSEKPEIEWYHAVHPGLLLSLRQQGREVVPLNINLNNNQRILIISGPNAGGKSVCLKTVAVVQYMTQCGLLPTVYYNSHIGMFSNLLIDIGDEQSFENDLSTYSSHLRNMKVFLSRSDSRTLFLADEMGSGTEPQIGGALAQAILEQLGKSGAYGIVSTHYQNLKTFADFEPGFVNGAMLYDRAKLQPTFQLSVGNPGSSFAIDIAFKTGIPAAVVQKAKEIVGSDYVNLDKYLSDVARDRRYWQNKRMSIREKENKLDQLLAGYEETAGDLRQQRKAIINDARREAKEILSGANAMIERTILEIRKSQAEKEKTKELRKNLKEYSDSLAGESSEEKETMPAALKPLKHKSRQKKTQQEKEVRIEKKIEKGDYVSIDGGTSVGQVLDIKGSKAEIVFGALRTIAEINRLKHAKKPKTSAAENKVITISDAGRSRERQLNFKNEIDVRGMRADEAIHAVTYFIDDAIQFSAGRVRILHGTGHGILKTLIRQYLKSNTGVKAFEDEDVRFGGAGITVVDLE